MQKDSALEWFKEGMSAPFENIRWSMFFVAIKTALMSLQTNASKDLISNAINQISSLERMLNFLDIMVGFLIGFSNILAGLLFLAGFTFIWITMNSQLASLGFTLQDAIFTTIPVITGMVLRGYYEYKRRELPG